MATAKETEENQLVKMLYKTLVSALILINEFCVDDNNLRIVKNLNELRK